MNYKALVMIATLTTMGQGYAMEDSMMELKHENNLKKILTTMPPLKTLFTKKALLPFKRKDITVSSYNSKDYENRLKVVTKIDGQEVPTDKDEWLLAYVKKNGWDHADVCLQKTDEGNPLSAYVNYWIEKDGFNRSLLLNQEGEKFFHGSSYHPTNLTQEEKKKLREFMHKAAKKNNIKLSEITKK